MGIQDILRKVKVCLLYVQVIIVVFTLLRTVFKDVILITADDELSSLMETKKMPSNTIRDVLAKYNAGPLESSKTWNNAVLSYLRLQKEYFCEEHFEEVFSTRVLGQEKVKVALKSAFLNSSNSISTNVCVYGRQGTGKTEIITQIAKATGRNFQTISLAGRDKHNTLHGNNGVYKNSTYGPITKCLLDANCSNPIIFIDELDKADTEIQNSLLMIIDKNHRSKFTDHYLDPLPIDLTDVTFVFACNDKSLLIQPLQDRLSFIEIEELEPNMIVRIGHNFFKEQKVSNVNIGLVRYIYDNYIQDKRSVRSMIEACKTFIAYINLKRPKIINRKIANDCFEVIYKRIPKTITNGVTLFQPPKRINQKRNAFEGYVGKLGSE